MLEKFNNFFGIRADIPLQRTKLEDALLEKYGSLVYNRFDPREYRPELSVSYTLGVKQEFSEYCDYHTEEYYNSAEEALMGLFIEQCTEPKLDINDIGRYYTDLDKKDEQGFREIIKEVYHVL